VIGIGPVRFDSSTFNISVFECLLTHTLVVNLSVLFEQIYEFTNGGTIAFIAEYLRKSYHATIRTKCNFEEAGLAGLAFEVFIDSFNDDIGGGEWCSAI